MPAPISSILPVAIPQTAGVAAPASKPGAFASALESAIGAVEQTRADANKAVDSFLRGETEDVHTAALATQKAELSFELGMQVRNKVVSAYQEIMRMQM
jgi:flagellar hook-basal body complex protein FliE